MSDDSNGSRGWWWTCDSGMKVDPEIMFEVHKNNKLVKSLLDLWKESAGGQDTGLSDLVGVLDMMVAQDTQEWIGRKPPEELGCASPEELRVALDGIRDTIFNTTVKFKIHSRFDPEALLMVDFSFLPQEFFYHPDHKLLKNIFFNMKDPKAPVKSSEKTSRLDGLTTIRGTLGFYDLGQEESASFKFHGPQEHTDFVKKVIKHFLVSFGNMPIESELSWLLGFLFTYKQNPQDPHIDFDHKSLKSFREDVRNKDVASLLPWSMDIPLTPGGLKLQFYGPEECLEANTSPCVVEVPARHVLLWRGDCVHSGGLLDLDGQHGFRMHGYLNLVKAHMPLTNSVLRTIDWRNEKGKRYMNYLKHDEGEKYIEGCSAGSKWISVQKAAINVLESGATPGRKDRGNPDLADLKVGSRVSVWWTAEKEYYAATVTTIEDQGSKRYYLEYDDGDHELTNLAHRTFFQLDRATL